MNLNAVIGHDDAQGLDPQIVGEMFFGKGIQFLFRDPHPQQFDVHLSPFKYP